MSRQLLLLLALFLSTAAAAPSITANSVPADQADNRELHVVSIGRGVTKTGDQIHAAKAAVRVDRPGKVITLVLCANEAVTWDVTLTSETRLSRVVLGGHDKQTVRELPPQVEVVEAFQQRGVRPPIRQGGAGGQPPVLRMTITEVNEINSSAFQGMVETIHQITGQEIASFQGAFRADTNKPFVVDRVQDDPRLRSDYPQPVPAERVPKLEFRALDFIKPRPNPGMPQAMTLQGSYRDFTLTGPTGGDSQPLPVGVLRVAVNPASKEMYGIVGRIPPTREEMLRGGGFPLGPRLVEVDMANQGMIPLIPGSDLPQLDWPMGIAFDTKRHRLLVAAHHLYAYEPKNQKWSVLAELKGFSRIGALAYHPGQDTLYVLGQPEVQNIADAQNLGTLVLFHYDHTGQIVEKIRLGEPLTDRVIHLRLFSASEAALQMFAAGDSLVIIATHPNLETYIFLVDPKTGQAQLTWRAQR